MIKDGPGGVTLWRLQTGVEESETLAQFEVPGEIY